MISSIDKGRWKGWQQAVELIPNIFTSLRTHIYEIYITLLDWIPRANSASSLNLLSAKFFNVSIISGVTFGL